MPDLLREPESLSLGEIDSLSLAIKYTIPAREQAHIAFVFSNANDELRLSHLANHFQYENEEWDMTYHWHETGLHPVAKEGIAAFLDSLVEPDIPYGLSMDGCSFKEGQGSKVVFEPNQVGKGLTCATFILAVLNHLNVPLLKLDSWEERLEDQGWQEWICGVLERQNASEAHLEGMRADYGAVRYRPQEVMGAATMPGSSYPVDFDDAKKVAEQVIADLEAALNP